MEDDELAQIRARRLAELQGGSAQPQQVKKKIPSNNLFSSELNHQFKRVVDFPVPVVWVVQVVLPRKMLKRRGNTGLTLFFISDNIFTMKFLVKWKRCVVLW